ncbi:hypothetical protein BABINDRAFT_8428 [Babjeviella inositovora NRRL Y-12698]|uniref:Uncharacterized protein n=1 Tax=Babjeviella inositovora NRRL Y-12698 TaxID=984486 RepID=A0A1E3QRD1_9ASCO|nr:uncharacterized protein BABINDRAFT_8428 [Babjeviella inositovora NRRL Y-12698]ODQ79507.1 hypothetical protein BABINDRAFT_8428 [Babjeviella inositovora NRRL Y-12698]
MISIDIAAPTYTLHHELSSATVLGLRQFLPLAPHPSPIFSPVEDTPQTIMDPLGFSSGTIDPRKVFVMTPPASLKLPYDFSQAPRKIHIPRANGLHSPVISPTFVNRLGSNDPGAYTDYCNLTEGRMANFGDSGNELPEAYDSRSSFDSASSLFWGIDSPTPSIYGETSETCASPSTMLFEFCERTLESSLTNNMNSKEFLLRGDMGTDGAGLDKDVVDSLDELATDGETSIGSPSESFFSAVYNSRPSVTISANYLSLIIFIGNFSSTIFGGYPCVGAFGVYLSFGICRDCVFSPGK